MKTITHLQRMSVINAYERYHAAHRDLPKGDFDGLSDAARGVETALSAAGLTDVDWHYVNFRVDSATVSYYSYDVVIETIRALSVDQEQAELALRRLAWDTPHGVASRRWTASEVEDAIRWASKEECSIRSHEGGR